MTGTAGVRTDPRGIVLRGYELASHAYRGDEFALAGSRYEYWLGRFVRRLTDGARILDVGCGNGLPVARELAARFAVTGVDLSPVQIERARALVPAARFECADMTALDYAPASFDAITAFYSIINVPLPEQPSLIRRMAGWLAPGGWIIATVGQEPWTGVESDWRGVRGAQMYYSHGAAEHYRAWFAAAGLELAEQGREPRTGNPGYAMLLARRAGAEVRA